MPPEASDKSAVASLENTVTTSWRRWLKEVVDVEKTTPEPVFFFATASNGTQTVANAPVSLLVWKN